MHERSLSLSTISGTESEAGDEPFAGSVAYDTDEDEPDEPDLNTEFSDDSSISYEHEHLTPHDALQHVVNSLSKLKPPFFWDSDVPYQPPHPHHLPSPLEVAQTKALIEDREVEVSEYNSRLDELARRMLKVIHQRHIAAKAARNHRSFIAGKC